MIVEVSELCPSCRQLPGVAGMTVEATINAINSNKGAFPLSDDQANAMIYSCIYKYNDVSHSCLRLISDMVPPYMKGR